MFVAIAVTKGLSAEGFEGGCVPQTPPTTQNPLMNLLVTELKRIPAKPIAMEVSVPNAEGGVRDTLDEYFKTQMWSDPADAFNHTQSQRAFITQPSTTNPNDMDNYLRYVYGGMMAPTCKEGYAGRCGLDRATQGTVRG